MADSIERLVKVKLPAGGIVYVRLSIASTIIVGPGPRPKRWGFVLQHSLDGEAALTVDCEIDRGSAREVRGMKAGATGTKMIAAAKKAGAGKAAPVSKKPRTTKSIRVGPGGRMGGG